VAGGAHAGGRQRPPTLEWEGVTEAELELRQPALRQALADYDDDVTAHLKRRATTELSLQYAVMAQEPGARRAAELGATPSWGRNAERTLRLRAAASKQQRPTRAPPATSSTCARPATPHGGQACAC
jgi:hypothetical protein